MNFDSISDVEDHVLREDWIEMPLVPGLYISAGQDTRPMSLLHPEFLDRQGGGKAVAPNFLVYVDKGPLTGLYFKDERTEIVGTGHHLVQFMRAPGLLLRMSMKSHQFEPRNVAVLKLQMTNDEFAASALTEGWHPDWLISVCDGCGMGGGNQKNGSFWCDNHIRDTKTSIPLQLGARYWVTDHIFGMEGGCKPHRSGGRDDLADGDAVLSANPDQDIRLRQLCFLSTSWRSRSLGNLRLYGGARVFEIERPLRRSIFPVLPTHFS